jgi:integrase/recombinase XerD
MSKLQTLTQDPRTTIETLLQSDPRLVSYHTKRQYRSDLIQFEEWRGGRTITKILVEAYAAELQGGGYAPNTINQKLAALRWYARKIADLAVDYLHNEELAKDAARVMLVKDVKGKPQDLHGRHIETWELRELLKVCSRDKNRAAGARDAALFATAWATGIRRDIFTLMEMSDLKKTEDGYDLQYIGKGQKSNTAYITNGAADALTDWIRIRGSAPGRVFVNVIKSGKVRGGKLSGVALLKILLKRSLQAGLPEPITWHDFRRTFCGNLWDANVDGSTIQKLMSHANQNQTARYDRRPERLRRKAVGVLQVPYKSREE